MLFLMRSNWQISLQSAFYLQFYQNDDYQWRAHWSWEQRESINKAKEQLITGWEVTCYYLRTRTYDPARKWENREIRKYRTYPN